MKPQIDSSFICQIRSSGSNSMIEYQPISVVKFLHETLLLCPCHDI